MTSIAWPAMRDWNAQALAEPFRDPPHDAELSDVCNVLEDLRAPETTP